MNKIIATFQNREPITVERVQDGLTIGRYNLTPAAFIESMAKELPFENLFALVVEQVIEDNAFNDYFDEIYIHRKEKKYTDFLNAMLNNAPSNWLDEPKLHDFVINALSQFKVTKEDETVILNLFRSVKRIITQENQSVFVELALQVFSNLINSKEKEDSLKKFLSLLYSNLNVNKKEELDDWFVMNIDSIPSDIKAEVIVKVLEDKNFLRDVYRLLNSDKKAFNTWLNEMVDNMPLTWRVDGFKRTVKPEDVYLKTIQIPKNCVNIDVSVSKLVYSIEIPKKRMRVKFGDIAYEDVGHPKLLAKIEVVDEKFQSMSLFAIKDGEDILYKYPYSNVYDSGKVCWHVMDRNTIISLKEIEMLPMMFLSTPNNSHLNSKTLNLYLKYQGKDFDDSELEPFTY
ncbi:hypothetical protein [Lysinibacillus sphaericus]|uniref:Uncharacterized protein n=1 Tax=Lysinibacillus sphaericus TaxID=1421 RepID=A0A6G9ZZR3_LYSSH|nr:hypothetical protein [Lysinibacillus sphaericus]QIS31211.1 hypothetical protein [Lysinibacillus sphaericus]QPA61242.1 hypothetical protein INQ55_23180 [Lysinibacillus sphaericus]